MFTGFIIFNKNPALTERLNVKANTPYLVYAKDKDTYRLSVLKQNQKKEIHRTGIGEKRIPKRLLQDVHSKVPEDIIWYETKTLHQAVQVYRKYNNLMKLTSWIYDQWKTTNKVN